MVSLQSWAGRESKWVAMEADWGSELGDPDRTMWPSLDGVSWGFMLQWLVDFMR